MKAKELAELLLRVPEAEVEIQSVLVQDIQPIPFEDKNIIFNNEANAWIVLPPEPSQRKSLYVQT